MVDASSPGTHPRATAAPASSSSVSADASAPASSPVARASSSALAGPSRRRASTARPQLAEVDWRSLGRSEPEQLEHVLRRRERRRAEPEEVVRARGERAGDLARNGEHLAPLLEREIGGDQRAAALARLDDDRRGAEPRDDPVPRREPPGRRLDAGRVLRDDEPGRANPRGELARATRDSRGRSRSRAPRPSSRPPRARLGAPRRRCRAQAR